MNDTTKKNLVHPQTVEVPQPLEVHPSVSPKAAELLLKVCEQLAREPESYHQGAGYVDSECGAPCCILGHMFMLENGGRPERGLVVWSSNGKEFGLTHTQSRAIYYSDKWPAPFTQANDGVRVAPSVGIARIEHFLRTGE